VLLPEGINFLPQRIMFHLPEDSHVLFPEDIMQLSQRIICHFPEDSAFFPKDRMHFSQRIEFLFSQRINVHFPEDKLFHFPKTYFYLNFRKTIKCYMFSMYLKV